MLVSIPVCLLFLSILVVSDPYLTWISLIVVCTISLLLRCLLSQMYGTVFNMVIMLSPLISRMITYIFQLLSNIIIFYSMFGKIDSISGKFYLFGWPKALEFSRPSLNLSCSLSIARISILLSFWMISWSLFALSRQAKVHVYFCIIFWFN